MNYVNEWKMNELVRYNQMFKEYCETYAELYSKYSQALDSKQRESYLHGEKTKDFGDLNTQYEQAWNNVKTYKTTNTYFANIFDRVMWFYRRNRDELSIAYSDAEERFKKDIDSHFNKLQAKVENKIGTIEKIASLGGDDYRFEGSLGFCTVEVILAGGYNIQRLHTRWIIRDIRLKDGE